MEEHAAGTPPGGEGQEPEREWPAVAPAGGAPARPGLSLFGWFGVAFLVIGALGLLGDYTLSWAAEQPRGSDDWAHHSRADLAEAYSDVTFYSQGFLIWTWAAWIATIAAGAGLLAAEALRRHAPLQARVRTVLLTGHILAAGMMLLTVSRRFGSQLVNRRYNGIDFYAWEGASWVHAVAAPLLVLAAGYLLWQLRRTHPPRTAPGKPNPHPNALTFATGTILIAAAALLLSPWLPIAVWHLPAIIGDRWITEGTLHGFAEGTAGTRALAGQGYVGATRALFVTIATALVTAFGIIGWQRARTPMRARVWGLIAQTHLLAIVPLHLGLRGYNIYVQYLGRDNTELLANQFIGIAIDILLVTWVAHVMWITVPYLKRWHQEKRNEEEETREDGGHASPTPTP